MITLTQAERLVRKIIEVMGQPAAETQAAKLAQDYADLCRTANRRLKQCALMVEAEQFLQALQLAEAPPPLLDLITVLSFRQAADWRTYCQAHHLPWPEPFYDKYIRLLNSSYGKGIAADHPFYRDYRRAVMRKNDERALSILRVIARLNPADENTKAELKRLEEKLLRVKLENLQRILVDGDNAATQAQVAQIEASGVEIPPGHPAWQQAQVVRCQELLRQAEDARDQDDWQRSERLVEEIHTIATHYNVQLPASDADSWSSLEEWTLAKRRDYAAAQDFQRAVAALELEIEKNENKWNTSTFMGLAEARSNYNLLADKWSAADRFGRPIDPELIARYQDSNARLKKRMRAALQRQRTISVIITLVVLGAIAAAIPSIHDWIQQRDFLRRLGKLESARRVADTETLFEATPARIKSKPEAAQGVNKARSFILREDALKQSFDKKLKDLQQFAADNFKNGMEQAGPLRVESEAAEARLAPEFQPAAASALAAWDSQWESVRDAALSAHLDRAEQMAAKLNSTNGFDSVQAVLPRIQTLLADVDRLSTGPPEIKQGLENRYRRLTDKTALWTNTVEQWERSKTALVGSQSLEEYLDRLDQMVLSPFASTAQRDSAAEIDRLKLDQTTFLGELLLPGERTHWDILTNTAAWTTSLMPDQPTAQEKDEYFKLRDDKNMQDVYVYQLITNSRPRNPFHSHPVFVQGSISPDRGGEESGVVFDPTEGGDAAHFTLQAYSDWDYINVKKMFRTQECDAFERIGLAELIDPNTGNFQKPILQLFDQLTQDENSSAVFRAVVILKLAALAELRPNGWGMMWSPTARRNVQTLKDLGGVGLKSGDWMVKEQVAKYEIPLERFFESARPIPVQKQANFLRQLTQQTCDAGFEFAGYIDVNGRPVLRDIRTVASEYWGWASRSGSAALILRKNATGPAYEKIAEPMAFTPLFVFMGDRHHLLNETSRATLYPAGAAAVLPPFFADLYE